MSDTHEGPDDAAAATPGDAALLSAKVAAMRAVLVRLLQQVVQAETRLDQSRAAQLLEANERLVIAAMGAQTEADTAYGALDEAARIGSLDPLTALPNRTLLLNRFESAILGARRRGNRVALLFIDLDSFKQINDTRGHAAGDAALQLVAACLTALVRESDTVSRHGGDEFLILLAEVAHASDAAHVAGKVNAALAAERGIGGFAAGLSVSIGISLYPEDGDDPKTLIDRADAAMYRAKKRGPGGYLFHGQLPAAASAPWDAAAPPESRYESLVTEDPVNLQIREANQALVLAALGAQELLTAAEQARDLQAELLAMVARELADPFAPIRLAAATLGLSDAETRLLERVQELLEQHAEKMARKVAELLASKGGGTSTSSVQTGSEGDLYKPRSG